MFKHHYRKSANPILVLFRLILSLIMFAVLLTGVYLAYKHFSGFDPLKLDPQAVLKSVLSSTKLTQKLPPQIIKLLPSDNSKVVPARLDSAKRAGSQVLGQLTPVALAAVRFLLIADSHSDNTNLQKAISQAKDKYPDLAFIIGLGDYTNVGTVDELRDTKKQFDIAALRYFLVPGDHDLWDSRNQKLAASTNFKQVFGPVYQSFSYGNFRFLLLDNSDDYLGFGDPQLDWVSSELDKSKIQGEKGIFVFLHEPLYHPSSDHYMGKLESSLKQQAQVKKVFSGDIHYFSEYDEPITKLSMTTVGAVAIERNPQAPRYAIVTVYEDGSTKVDDIEIKVDR